MLITTASVHDVNVLDNLQYEIGSFYILDRGYVDFSRLYNIHLHKAYFYTSAKKNFRIMRMYSNVVDKATGVLCDQIGMLEVYQSKKDYPTKIRRIKHHDRELDRNLVFISNNLDLEAFKIALLYKNRRKVEFFFKWIKQHLKVKTFWGTTMNAVKTQVYCAVITYRLVAIIGNKLKVDRPIYEILSNDPY